MSNSHAPVETKICGLSTKDSIDAVIKGGAAHIGLIFFEKSPRHVSISTAKVLADHAHGRISKVVVTVNADDDYLDAIVAATKPEILQLHGNESPDRVRYVKQRYGLPVMKAFAIREREDLDNIQSYIGVADRFLFDAKPPSGSDLPGGNGVAFDWEIMDHLPQNVQYMLSGGLDAQNIKQAIAQSGASAIDISSGVESAPGVKDTAMIEKFLSEVKC